MKYTIILILLAIGIGFSNQAKAQFVPSIRVSSLSAELDWTSDLDGTIENVLKLNSIGVGPSISMETKRLTFQAAILKHFNSSGGSISNANNSTASIKRIPSEFNFTLGYKINANKSVQVYPFFTFGRYNLKLETTEVINSNTAVSIDRIILSQVGGGLGAQYSLDKLKFDMQAKLKSNSGGFQNGRYSGADLSVNFSIGYIL